MYIPKRIFQTWKTHQIPEKWKSSPESLQRLHPDWKYTLMSDKDNLQFVRQHFAMYLNIYNKLPKSIMKADMIRYMWLYTYGGIYIDLDYEAIKKFDDLFSSSADLFLIRTPNFGGYTNSFMASRPKCRFWIECLRKIQERVENIPWYMPEDYMVLWVTGPIMLTDVVKEYNCPFVTIPAKLCHPCSVYDKYSGTCDYSEAYVKELEGSSWTGVTTQIAHFFVRRWRDVLVFMILIFLFLLLIFFQRQIC